jgi:hypothetical protein
MLQIMLFDSVRLFRNQYIGIAMIVLPIFIPIEIFDSFYSNYIIGENSTIFEKILPMFIGSLAYPVYTAGMIFYIASVVAGETIDTKTSWRLGVKNWVPFFILSIFVGIIITVGFLLLIIPGIIFVARYAFAEFDLLLNNRLPLDAMRDSWETTRKYVSIILGGYLVITIVLYGPYCVLLVVLEQQELKIGMLDSVLNIIYSVLDTIYTIFAFRVYHLAKEQHNNGLNPTSENGAV